MAKHIGAKIVCATGNAPRSVRSSHLTVAAGRRSVTRVELLFVIRHFVFQFFVFVFIFGIIGVHLNGDFKLFFAFVSPVLFIKNHRLQIMPFRAAVGEQVKFILRFVNFPVFYKFFYIGKFGKPAVFFFRRVSLFFYILVRFFDFA